MEKLYTPSLQVKYYITRIVLFFIIFFNAHAVYSTNYTGSWTSITITNNLEFNSSNYTLNGTNPASGGSGCVNSCVASGTANNYITFSAETNVSTLTSFTINGIPVATYSFQTVSSTVPNRIVFTTPVQINKGTAFTFVINGITNTFPGTYTPSLWLYNVSGAGQVNGFTSGASYTIVGAPMTVVSTTTKEINTAYVQTSSTNNRIVAVEIVTQGSLSPLTVTSFNFTTAGTTNLADIANARLWIADTTCYGDFDDGGSISAYSSQFGSTIASPGATMTFTGSKILTPDKQPQTIWYIWLMYDVTVSATAGNLVDAGCTSITIGGTPYTPSVTSPPGSRIVLVPASPNLVPNWSFENGMCPTTISGIGIGNATSWLAPTWGTPDYFATCFCLSDPDPVLVPRNFLGWQYPRTGERYAGAYTYSQGWANSGVNYREYVYAPLTSPLTAGVTYTVSFYVSLSNFSQYKTDGIGAYLSVGSTGGVGNNENLPYTPQIVSPGVISDTANWVLISGTYVAAGGENYITVGNFKNNASTTVQPSGVPINSGSSGYGAYYYIDDISVVEVIVPLPIELLSFTGECTDNHVQLNWQTATETNNNYFVIERAFSSGSSSSLNWSEVGIVNGAGNSSSTINYNFDFIEDIGSGILYYRLKQVDYNGLYKYYGPIPVNCEPGNEWNLILQNTPADNELLATLFSPSDAEIQAEIFDIQGRKIVSKTLSVTKGSNLVQFDLTNASSGFYIIRINDAERQISKKFVKK